MKKFFNFTEKEIRIFKKLNTPKKIQDFINAIPINFEKNGETFHSPREVLARNIAHCSEAAILAAVILWYHGKKPLLMDLRATNDDVDHVVALFKEDGYWGAISKTNHGVLRYREPIYKTLRELALSYFHEYFKDDGRKTLREYSEPFDLSKIKDRSWLTSSKSLVDIIIDIDDHKHHSLINRKQIRNLRKADRVEIEIGKITEYKK